MTHGSATDSTDTTDTAAEVLRRTLAAPPTLGNGRLVCIDGPAGSGKTTLAAAVSAAVPEGTSRRVVHMDDVYPGWDGLLPGVERVALELVAPLARGQAGGYRRYDWVQGRPAEWHEVEPVDLLVLEGVGSGAAAYDAAITTLVWVEAPRDLRLSRGLARDGETLRPQWLAWMRDEDVLFARERTRERADVLVSGVPVSDS